MHPHFGDILVSRRSMQVAFVTDIDIGQNSGNSSISYKCKAYDEVCHAIEILNARKKIFFLNTIECTKLCRNATEFSDTIYNSDIFVVDMTDVAQQGSLHYHLGLRQNHRVSNNIVIVCLENNESVANLRIDVDTSVKVIPYIIGGDGIPLVFEDENLQKTIKDNNILLKRISSGLVRLSTKIEQTFREMKNNNSLDISKTNQMEKLIAELKAARETLRGEDLRNRLEVLRRRLDDPVLLSSTVLLNFLLSYRKCDAFDEMINLIEEVKKLDLKSDILDVSMIQYLYAFALNRRKKPGDSECALEVINNLISSGKNLLPDFFGLLGRIYKDRFEESSGTNTDALHSAIDSYRSGLKIGPDEYLFINIATLLVIAGYDLETCDELRYICNAVNLRVGQKGDISTLTDYWDVATIFEIRTLSKDYTLAVQAVKRMYDLNPPDWQLITTLNNIQLIEKYRPRFFESEATESKKLFDFWMEFLSTICQNGVSSSKRSLKSAENLTQTSEDTYERVSFPVLISDKCGELEPAYIQVNVETDQKDIIISAYMQSNSTDLEFFGKETYPNTFGSHDISHHDLTLHFEDIGGISSAQSSSRIAYLYVRYPAQDFKIHFPCSSLKKEFYDLLQKHFFTKDQDYRLLDAETPSVFKWCYDEDENNQPIILGRGGNGVVYAGRDLNREIRVAIKEINLKDIKELQPMRDVIRMHSRLHHRNIVQCYTSIVENGYLKIFMEAVQGASLTKLLNKFGKFSEEQIAKYSKQILQGLSYLHENKVVHRDIKGDNILVDMYTGEVKITDFGESKRLGGLIPRAKTIRGTMPYMAPELINNSNFYDLPVDIWSFGCTVIQMLTGAQPFKEFDSPYAIVYYVGTHADHPKIPEEVSEECRTFVLRTFTANPKNRATASDLLQDSFIRMHNRLKRSNLVERTAVCGTPTMTQYLSERRDLDCFCRPFSPTSRSPTENSNSDLCTDQHMDRSFIQLSPLPRPSQNCFKSLHSDKQLSTLRLPKISGSRDPSPNSSITSNGSRKQDHVFNCVRQNKKAKQSLASALILEKNAIADAWLDLNSRCRQTSFFDNETVYPTSPKPATHLEKPILDCLLDMLIDHFQGGSTWLEVSLLLEKPACEILHEKKDSNNDSGSPKELYTQRTKSSDLQTRFVESIIASQNQSKASYYLPLGTPLVCSYLRTTIAALNSAVEEPLKNRVDEPHQLFLWSQLIQDVISSADAQLKRVARMQTSVQIRRNKTFAARGANSTTETTLNQSNNAADTRLSSRHVTIRTPRLKSSISLDWDKKDNDSYQNPTSSTSNYDQSNQENGSLSLATDDEEDEYASQNNMNIRDSNLAMKDTSREQDNPYDEINNYDALYKALQLMSRCMNQHHRKRKYTKTFKTGYESLDKWFTSLGIPAIDRRKLEENYINDEEEFLNLVTKEDLWNMKLSGGTVLRIWRQILEIRNAK